MSSLSLEKFKTFSPTHPHQYESQDTPNVKRFLEEFDFTVSEIRRQCVFVDEPQEDVTKEIYFPRAQLGDGPMVSMRINMLTGEVMCWPLSSNEASNDG